ncbi:hypothetical protein AVEN_270072-1, partial [Araneus ventricosus]
MKEDEFNVQLNQLKKVLAAVQKTGEIICFNALSVLTRFKNTVRSPKLNLFWAIIRQM